MRTGERQAGARVSTAEELDEINVTEEMIVAGVGALDSYRPDAMDSELVVAVYTAMRRALFSQS